MPALDPAASVIKRCGGIATVADWFGVHRSSVQRWTYPRERGGTGGLIPSRHQAELLARATAAGVELTAGDFFPEARRLRPTPAAEAAA